MPAPIYVSPKAPQIIDSRKKKTPAQTHHYHVRVNTTDCQCCDTRDDVTMTKTSANRLNAAPSNGRGAGQPADPVGAINEICDRLGERLKAVYADMGLDLPAPITPPSESPLDQILARLTWLDRALTIAEHHTSGLERAIPPRAANAANRQNRQPAKNAQSKQRPNGKAANVRASGPSAYQPRGEEAKSVVSNMGNLTFTHEHGADAFEGSRGLAKQASPAMGAELTAREARSMMSPAYAPADPLEDRYQRGESERPREIVDTYPKGDPYRSGGVSSAPGAPSPGGGGKELKPLDPSTGASKYAWGKTFPTGDHAPSTAEVIRALSRKESQMMRQIKDEISIVVKSRWN